MLAQTKLGKFLHHQTSVKHSLPSGFYEPRREEEREHIQLSPDFWEGLFAWILAGFVLAGTCTGNAAVKKKQKAVATWAPHGSPKALTIWTC